MNEPTIAPVDQLLPIHTQYLRDRAVPIDLAVRSGLRSVDAANAAQLLGRDTAISSGGLAIPYNDANPCTWRVRVDEPGSGPRYLCPRGREVPIYVAPLQQPGSADDPTVVVESPIKALSVTAALGLRALGLGGTSTTLKRSGDTRILNSSWSRVPVAGRKFVLLLDANRKSNPSVARDEARLAKALESSGAEFLIATLPEAPDGRGWGPDDYLAINGAESLRQIIADAHVAEPAKHVAAMSPTDVPDLLDDLPFLLSVHERGAACRKRVRDALKASAGITFRDFDDAMARAARKLHDAHSDSQTRSQPATQYEVRNGAICHIERTFRDGEVLDAATPLCNFSASIVKEVVTDDGVSESRSFEVEGQLADGTALERIVLSPDEFSSGFWPMHRWGSRAIVGADRGTSEHLRAAIQQMSTPDVTRTFSHTGWRSIGGRMAFLHANGAIGALDVQTHLSGRLARYRLPYPPLEPATALKTSLRILDIAPRRLTIPLIAAVYRAPVQSILFLDSVIWLCGKTGSLKSTLAALVLSHFGQFDRSTLPASWHDTFAHIEFTGSAAKDLMYVLDDYAPRVGDCRDELHRKADLVIRSYGNRAGRARMRSDLTEHAERPPRGLLVTTAEDLPTGQSIIARSCPVHIDRAEVNTALLSEMQAQQDRLPHAMTAYIEWLRQQYDTLGTRLRERFAVRRADFQRCQTHLRTPETLAHLALGVELLCDFATSLGVMSRREAGHFAEEAMLTLSQLGDVQGETVAEENPTEMFLRWLRTLLAQGRVELVSSRDKPLLPVGNTQQIGWLDTDGAYLLPEATFAAVVSAMRSAGVSMPLKETTLWARLRAAGAISAGDAGHATTKRVCAGKRERVIVMSIQVLGLGEPSGAPEDGAPPPVVAVPGEEVSPQSGRPGSKAGHETSKAEPAPAEAGGEEEEDQAVASSSPPSRPGAPADRAGSRIADFPLPNAERPETPIESCTDSPRIGESRGTGALLSNPADTQQDPRPSDRDVPGISFGAQLPSLSYRLLSDPSGLPAVAAAVAGAGTVALDIETTGLDPLRDRPRLLQLGMPDGTAVVIDLFQTGGIGPVARAIESAQLLGHNLQFDLSFLKHHYNVDVHGIWDTMVAAKLLAGGDGLHEKGVFTLAGVCKRELGIDLPKELQRSDWSGELSREQLEYATRDVAVLPLLKDKLSSAVSSAALDCVAALEFDVVPVAVGMELAGLAFSPAAWKDLLDQRRAEADTARGIATTTLQIENIDSWQQVSEGLHRIGVAASSTAADSLAPFRDRPAVRALLDYRRAGGFCRGIGEAVLRALDLHGDGRIHPHIDPLAAPTGRFGCRQPNLLALPKIAAVRRAVVPQPGCKLVVSDFSAIELRVLAQVTGDPGLISLFNHRGDPHRRTAAAMLGIAEEKVTKADRQRAKPVNFGFAFGMGAERFVTYALADYGVVFSLAEAKRFKAVYLHTYPGVERWQREVAAQRSAGVRTASGRLRIFDDPRRGYCKRLNTPVQGTAADGMKAALVLLHQRLPTLDARLVLCVHDEVLVEAPLDRAEEVKTVVETSMIEGMQQFVTAVPIVVEASIRSTWASEED